MAWHKSFDYKTDAEKYLEAEERREKAKKKEKAGQESILYKGSKAYQKYQSALDKPVPYAGQATGMEEAPFAGGSVGMEVLEASKRIQAMEIGFKRIQSEYEGNVKWHFPGLKMPNFSKVKSGKTEKLSLDKANKYRPLLRQFGALPIKPMTVYKYKEVDQKNEGAEVVVPQTAINAIGENKHNYFYIKGGKLGSIPKTYVSLKKIEKKDMEMLFMERINNIAKTKEKHEVLTVAGDNLVPAEEVEAGWIESTVNEIIDRSIKTISGASVDYDYDLKSGEPQKPRTTFKQDEPMTKEEAGQFRREAVSAGKSAAFGFIQEAAKPLTATADRIIDYSLEKQGPYAHDEEYFKEQTFKLEEGKISEKDIKKLDKFKKKQKKMEKAKLPKGYDKAYDVEFAGGTEEEIKTAKKQMDDVVHRHFRGEDKSWKPKELENNAKLTGQVVENIVEFFVGAKLVKGALSGFKVKGTASKIGKFIAENASTGALIGALQGIKDEEKGALDILKKATEEAIAFTAGSSATKVVRINPTSKPGILAKRLLKSSLWATGYETARTPFLEKEEKTLKGFAERAGVNIAFGVAFESATASGISKELARNKKLKIRSQISKKIVDKYNLNRDVRGMTPEQQDLIVKDTTEKLLAEVGKKARSEVGSYSPQAIFKKYAVITPDKFSVSGNLISDKQFAKIEMIKGLNGKIKEVKISYNKNKPEDQIAGAIVHETKHFDDAFFGDTLEPGKRIKNPKTLHDLMINKGHHAGMENFEMQYLERSIAETKKEFTSFEEAVTKKEIRKDDSGDFTLFETGEPISSDMSLYQQSKKAVRDVQPRGSVDLGTDNTTIWKLPKESFGTRTKNSAKSFYEFMVNENYSGEKIGKSTKYRMANYIKHHGTSHMINTERLVGRDGRHMTDRNFVDLIDAGPNNVDFDNYLKLRLHQERLVNPGGAVPIYMKDGQALSKRETAQKIKEIEQMFPEFNGHANELYQNIDDFSREWLVNLVTPENLNKMRSLYKTYVTIARVLPGAEKNAMKNRIAARVIKAAMGGTQHTMPIAYSLPKYVQKVVRSDRKNSIYLSMVENVINARGKLNQYATIVNPSKIKVKSVSDKIDSLTKVDDSIEHLFANMEDHLIADKVHGNFLVSLEKGSPITMQIHDDGLWKLLQNINSADLSEPAKILRGVKKFQEVFKAGWTKYNPIFWAFRNPMRDVPTSFIQTKNLPQWAGSMISSTVEVIKNSYPLKNFTTPSKLFQQYKALGNEQANFIKTEMAMTPTKARKLLNFIAAIGQGWETMPRYAEFRSTYKKWKPKIGHEAALEKASYDASEVTVNFARRGPGGKFMDTFAPYSNAKIQGLDKTMRTLLKRPASTVARTLGILTIPTSAIYYMNKTVNPVEYDNLPNHVKDNYYPIPIGDGNFVKIPKNNAYALVFSTLFERLFEHIDRNPDAWEGLGEASVKQVVIPQEILTSDFLGPIRNILTGSNKDFFGRDIVPAWMLAGKSKRSPEYQYDKYTTEPSKFVGKQVKMSPKQIDYLIKSYAGVVGSLYFALALQDGNMADKAKKLGLITDAKYGKREMKKFEEKDKAQRDVSDFEVEHGIDQIRMKARDEEINSVSEINYRIEQGLSSTLYDKWEELKKKRKEKEVD